MQKKLQIPYEKSPKTLKIVSVTHLNQYKLQVAFSDGKKQVVDIGPFLVSSAHPEIRKFLDLKKLKNFEIINGELMWDDFDLIFPLIDLYENKIQHGEANSKRLKLA